MSTEGRHFEIRGTVQGVGFRPWIFRLATEHGLTGWVRNDAAGVTIEVFGSAAALAAFERAFATAPPPAARIDASTVTVVEAVPPEDFQIVRSTPADERRVSIPPDLATCEDCLADIADPHNRRYRYAFTNCTNCGPRFTIARRVPYDRPHTTMAPFVMCAACRAEYEDPADRRFHAQPNACPDCGPRLWLCGPDGVPLDARDPLSSAADHLRAGRIVAVKGLGGFHLACDATNEDAIRTLRARKRRDEKPFAVMAASLSAAEHLAILSDDERVLLTSVARPIVIAARRDGNTLADGVAPRNPTVGIMLPYSPLHHLLTADVNVPLVMTSGNVSDEPLAYRNVDALRRLRDIADVFVMHDREIDTRCDDSVAQVIAGRPVVFRRSRGYTPLAVNVPFVFAEPTLACGGLLKNTFCLGVGNVAYLGPHIGDLENLETYESFDHAVRRLEGFVGVTPTVIAHDMHPGYLSTRYAASRGGATRVAVQHHHAHIASALAERGLNGPALGVAFDGTGFGPDGTAWGGEFLLVDRARFIRVGTFRPLALAGGDVAIRQVWRQALAVVLDAFDGALPTERLPVLAEVPEHEVRLVRQLLEGSVNIFMARGVGRYFDAAGALGLGRPVASFEGQIALAWNLVADPAERASYPWDSGEAAGLLSVDLRPTFRAIVDDVCHAAAPATISARFHNTLAEATVAVVQRLLPRLGSLPVVLSGGCFQNARLTESIVAALGSAVQVVRHELVPPGDGGLSLGQAAVASGIVDAGDVFRSEGLCA